MIFPSLPRRHGAAEKELPLAELDKGRTKHVDDRRSRLSRFC
jgi:hypothetical protein